MIYSKLPELSLLLAFAFGVVWFVLHAFPSPRIFRKVYVPMELREAIKLTLAGGICLEKNDFHLYQSKKGDRIELLTFDRVGGQYVPKAQTFEAVDIDLAVDEFVVKSSTP